MVGQAAAVYWRMVRGCPPQAYDMQVYFALCNRLQWLQLLVCRGAHADTVPAEQAGMP